MSIPRRVGADVSLAVISSIHVIVVGAVGFEFEIVRSAEGEFEDVGSQSILFGAFKGALPH